MKQLLVFLFLLCSVSVSAQDVIVKKDGSTIVCRVVEVTATEITYKKWGDLNGSNYVMDKSLASAINYESGKKESFSAAESLYKPNNQSDGVQQYNDKALLELEAASHKSTKKARTLRWIGGIGGITLAAAGIYLFAIREGLHTNSSAMVLLSSVPWSVSFFTAAYFVDRNAKKKGVIGNIIYQHDIPFHNGSSLSLGADLLSDRTLGCNTIGLGLRYNF